MPIDPSISLQMGQQPTPFQQAGQLFTLAEEVGKVRQQQEQRQDSQALQAYLKEGGNLQTPEGLTQASEWAKQNLSPQGYQTMIRAQEEAKLNQAKIDETYARMQPEMLQAQSAQNDFIAQQLEGVYTRYQQAKKEKGDVAAMQDFEAAKNQVLQSAGQQQMPGGRPLVNPQMLQRFQQMNPAEVNSAIQSTRYYQDRIKSAMDMQFRGAQIEKERAEAGAARALAEERRTKSQMGVAAGVPKEVAFSTATGDDFLKQLKPNQAALVKSLAEGRSDINSIPKAQREAYLQMANQYDPTFSAMTYRTKSGVVKDFTSGKTANNITSLNTSIGHLGTLSELGKALQNGDVPLVNRIVNQIKTQTGHPEATNFELAKIAVGEELMKTFRGSGASVQEAAEWKKQFDAARSPAQLQDSIKTGVELLNSRMYNLDEQWKRGMDSETGYKNLLTPHSTEVLRNITGEDYSERYNLPEYRGTRGAKPTETPTTAPAKPTARPTPTQADRDYIKSITNPEQRKKMEAKFREHFGVAP